MIDYRYHALSLAAVLLALALGVLLGVAIGDSNLVSSAKSGVVHGLEGELSAQRRATGELQEQLSRERAFAQGLYPLAMHEALSGRQIGLVFLGQSSDQVNALVRAAVAQAGGTLATVIAVREPPDLSSIAAEASGSEYASLAGSPGLLEGFGALIGRQLVTGGSQVVHELISRVRAGLLTAFDGELRSLEGVVVMRALPAGESSEESEASDALDRGLLGGIAQAGVTAVGVELSSTYPSQVRWYESSHLSSVDDLDRLPGQAALVYALAGLRGTFGTKASANSLLPSVAELPGAP
jgi:hypothetical protein